MQLTLRLYFPEDTDLMLMRCYEKRNFCACVIKCIDSYMEGLHYSYTLSDIGQDVLNGLPQSDKVNITLSQEKNPSAIAFVKKHGANASLVKALLRASFTEYPSKFVLSSLGFKSMPGSNIPDDDKTSANGESKAPFPAKKEIAQKPAKPAQTASVQPTDPIQEKETPASMPVQMEDAHTDFVPSAAEEEKNRDLLEMFLNM